jgi:hypothetical protein
MKITHLLLCCIILAAACSLAFSQTKTSADYLAEASRQYMAGEYKKAIPFL